MNCPTRIFLTKKDKITKYQNNLVTLTLADGTVKEPLEPRRLFPVSSLNEYITLLDEKGVEVAVIRELGDIDNDSKQVLNASLADYYLVPQIYKILSVSEKYGTIHWTVETDRGIKQFDIRDRNHDIRIYPDGRVRVRDADDNRYVIADYRALDKHSVKQLISDL